MEKETAIDWLVKELFPDNEIFGISNALIQQAKEMEKQQIIDAIIFFKERPHLEINAEQYYNETYNNESTNND